MERPAGRDGPRGSRGALPLLAAVLLAACASTPAPAPAPPAEPPPTAAPSGSTAAAPETTPQAKPARPTRVRKTARYTVQPGDTLWGIAQRFLIDPWKWPEVWVANEQVANPHLIYPGDVLELRWLEGSEAPQQVERVSPRVRELPLDAAIPTIPLDRIRDFLRGPLIVDAESLKNAPYVVEFDSEHVIGPDRVGIYASGLPDNGRRNWLVVRAGEPYVDPESRRVLGFEAIPAADAELQRHAEEVAVLELHRARRETRIGDRLIPRPMEELSANFYPRPPEQAVDGRIISVFGGVTQIGQYQIVTLNRGAAHGLERGHVLDVFRAGRRVADPERRFGKVDLPAEYAGRLLVFRVRDQLAQALVMNAVRPILLHDEVRRPRSSAPGLEYSLR